MSFGYRVAGIDDVQYFGTRREAERYKPGGEEPESVDRVDAAAECNRLERYVEEAERIRAVFRVVLEALLELCPTEIVYGTDTGKRAVKLLAEYPLPVATSADRDGGRSYGT